MYDVKLDEKYRLRVIDGKVELLRYDEEWLVNPEGAKAWISAAALIEETVNASAVHTEDEYPELTDRIDEKLTKAWGPFTRDTEIGILSKNLSRHLDAVCANSGVSPQQLIEALLG